MIFLLTILAILSADVRRCALPYLLDNPKRPVSTLSSFAVREQALTLRSYQTEHYVIWWSAEVGGTHQIIGAPGRILTGDSVPEMVRVAALALEKAWKTYVDTLHYLPPRASATSYLWGQAVPIGKYPVEICNVAVALGDNNNRYFGVAYPDGGAGNSMLMIAADLLDFGGWSIERDLDGVTVSNSYSTHWREAVRATCAHELFHAVQFNYERAVRSHGFFEASAVAMESQLVPESNDYLQYCTNLVELDKQVPFPTGIAGDAYPEGWQVRSMMADLGVDVVKALWESRKATNSRSPSFLSTLRQVLPEAPFKGSFDTQLVRHSARVALSGKRSLWHPSQLSLFPDGGQFPRLTGDLPHRSAATALPLALGGIQAVIDTIKPTEDRVFVWIPDEGVLMGHATALASQADISWQKGSVRYSATSAPRSVWTFANPGNPPALWAFAHSDSSISFYAMIAAPARSSAHAGQNWVWTSANGFVLSGTSRTEVQVTPLLHFDVWRPLSSKDPFAAAVANGPGGHALVLEDADHLLALSGATLRLDGYVVGNAYIGTGDGIWRPLGVAQSGNSSVLTLGELDLSSPVRILVGNGDAPGASSLVPRPNPSRHGAPVHFPIAGAAGSEYLDILAADGGMVREFRPESGKQEIVWDLRNHENRLVRPGIYWYVWRGATGSKRGKLLIAD